MKKTQKLTLNANGSISDYKKMIVDKIKTSRDSIRDNYFVSCLVLSVSSNVLELSWWVFFDKRIRKRSYANSRSTTADTE